ncbi:hypothetical protein EVAR_59168_1 [Eumeta japonica]|uniref:Uncharacterized protein n=1 Tax=Eumeta variegata TaxID=151549 RepID=A0A4C1YXF8_EUMVA|nr:hypothetical protein EVAR_59168_1 [Eumeta japonica]
MKYFVRGLRVLITSAEAKIFRQQSLLRRRGPAIKAPSALRAASEDNYLLTAFHCLPAPLMCCGGVERLLDWGDEGDARKGGIT